MKITRCYYISLADGSVEQTTNLQKAQAAFENGFEVGEMEAIVVSESVDDAVKIIVTRRWKREE